MAGTSPIKGTQGKGGNNGVTSALLFVYPREGVGAKEGGPFVCTGNMHAENEAAGAQAAW